MRIRSPNEIAPTLKKAFATPGPVLIDVRVDYRDNARLFETMHKDALH
jgi:acetolactate synthase-1/2/3 large subunit